MVASTEQVAEHLGEALAAFVGRRVRDPETARDLVQDVYERIHRRQDTLGELERVDAWVFRVARNVITDHYRRSGRAREREQALRGEAWGHDQEAAIGAEPSAEPGAVRSEVAAWLPGFVERLPDRYREVLELTELQGLPQAQAAERLGLSVTAVKSRVRRGRAQLERDLRGCCHIELDARGTVIEYAARQCACCD